MDIVVNYAGIVNYNEGTADVTDESCMELFVTNAMGHFTVSKRALDAIGEGVETALMI